MADKNDIKDEPELLTAIVRGSQASPSLYQPGQYWNEKCERSTRELYRRGISDFRGFSKGLATSFADNPLVDIRTAYQSGGLEWLKLQFIDLFPFNRFMRAQANLSKFWFKSALESRNALLAGSERVRELIDKYPVLDLETTRGGCVTSAVIAGREVSHHYLQLLDTIDRLKNELMWDTKEFPPVVLEIGGGFGTNAHLMIELFGIRKFVHVDISPNLYVATQYLKSFYGEAIVDYRRNQEGPIRFHEDDSLEVFCILPVQLGTVETTVDFFHNAHSFVEMPEETVRNYVRILDPLMENGMGKVGVVSYKSVEANGTLDPTSFAGIFSRSMQSTWVDTLTPGLRHLHLTSV